MLLQNFFVPETQNYTLPQILPFVNCRRPLKKIIPFGDEMIEKYLIEHCSPTLASLKTANLFSFPLESQKNAEFELMSLAAMLRPKGVEILVIKRSGTTALIYVYRRDMLQKDLLKPGVAEFLSAYGYRDTDIQSALSRLVARLLCAGDFPHEIGIFLGYPLNDVECFIKYGGRNCKCSGCWQAYENVEEAVKIFNRYKKCRAVYKKQWLGGRSLFQLTVSARLSGSAA